VTDDLSRNGESVRCAEVIAALSLATDLGIGVPLEYGLQSTLFAMRLADRLGVDPETASQTYYACLQDAANERHAVDPAQRHRRRDTDRGRRRCRRQHAE
jgi:hypothetical protein